MESTRLASRFSSHYHNLTHLHKFPRLKFQSNNLWEDSTNQIIKSLKNCKPYCRVCWLKSTRLDKPTILLSRLFLTEPRSLLEPTTFSLLRLDPINFQLRSSNHCHTPINQLQFLKSRSCEQVIN